MTVDTMEVFTIKRKDEPILPAGAQSALWSATQIKREFLSRI